jgi:hydrogenase expression/formation protein HypE
MGKLSTEDLKKLLSCIKKHPKVIVPPLPGFDSGVHLIDDDKYLVVTTDPCLGVPEKWFGWFLIHYAASDLALFGAKPEFCTINLLGPPVTKSEVFYEIMRQACSAADDLGMAVVTGHTGTYAGLSTLVGACTAYGVISRKKLITPGGARAGDYILCTKPVGLEIAVNFALAQEALAKKLFGIRRVQKLGRLISMQSCVKEAVTLAEIGGVHAMHDATEGGLTAALNEMAEASNVGFKTESEKFQIPKEVKKLQSYFNLSDEQVLSMSSTGTILAAVNAKAKEKVTAKLRQQGIKSSYIGEFTRNKSRILVKNGKETRFPEKADDPYEKIMSARQ